MNNRILFQSETGRMRCLQPDIKYSRKQKGYSVKTICILCIAALGIPSIGQAYEKAFEATNPGKIEVKMIPGRTLIAAQKKGDYFDENNRLFGQLFRYIRDNDVAMTTPVKASIDPGIMYFYIGTENLSKELKSTGEVTVITEPEYQVLSIGVRGGYSANNFEAARDKLLDKLATSKDWKKAGDAYAIYWNGPYVPGFMKRFEVHVPVRIRNAKQPVATE
jgi:effector-binding domain-containing protein